MDIRNYVIEVIDAPLTMRKKLYAVIMALGEPVYPETSLCDEVSGADYLCYDGEDWCLDSYEFPEPNDVVIDIAAFIKLYDKVIIKQLEV